MKRRPNTLSLNISPLEAQPQFADMSTLGVRFVHGSNSHSFAGLVRFRALLSMEEIDGTPWFHAHGLHSGERGYTRRYLYCGQPVSQGVSLNHVQNFGESLHYAKLGCESGAYPVLYGVGDEVCTHERFFDHPVSRQGINIDHVRAIYVPPEKVTDARLALDSLPRLSGLVRPLRA